MTADCVWAVDDAHLRNYLFPRDCPRITYAAGPGTTRQDRERFLPGSGPVAAIEHGWLEPLSRTPLHVYEMPPAPFALQDAAAGYWVALEAVEPIGSAVVADPLRALLDRGVEVRLLQDFWPLCDAVAASSLEFSIIRKRNARPRD
jgi:hypothetical protein